jgi:cytidine deaminase
MKKLNDIELKLLKKARAVTERARATHSHFKVGVALLSQDGKTFTGCNVESSSYGLTICAERCALVKALSEGADHFDIILIYSESEPIAPPCGACRQMLWDYAPNLAVISVNRNNDFQRWKLGDLFPAPFKKEILPRN